MFLREAIKKNVQKSEGVGPNPYFYIRISNPTLMEEGAKLLFPKYKFYFFGLLGLYPNIQKTYVPFQDWGLKVIVKCIYS